MEFIGIGKATQINHAQCLNLLNKEAKLINE